MKNSFQFYAESAVIPQFKFIFNARFMINFNFSYISLQYLRNEKQRLRKNSISEISINNASASQKDAILI